MSERILIVEDEAIVLLDIRSRLAGLGYTVVGTASTGAEAIAKAQATRPDIILMDIGLKGDIDGISAADSIRKTQDTPVIYLTANSDITTLQRAKITGPFGYVLKPFDERELRVTIEMALYKHRMDRDLNDARQWLNITLKNICDGVIHLDGAGTVKYMNHVAEALTGWSLDDGAGKALDTVFRTEPLDVAHVLPAYECVSNTGSLMVSSVAMLIDRGGCRKPVDILTIPIQDAWGKTLGIVYIFKDITDRLKGAKDLTDSQAAAEEQLQALLAVSDNPTLICDPWGTILRGNSAAAARLGFSAADFPGKNLLELGVLSPEESLKVASALKQAVASGSPISEQVTWVLRDGGSSGTSLKIIPLKLGTAPAAVVVIKKTDGL